MHHWTDRDDPVELNPDLSRWGHGGVYFTADVPDPPFAKRKVTAKGPFLVYLVDDEEEGSGSLWLGNGRDDAWNALLFETAAEVGIPGRPGLGCELPENADVFFIDYARELQRRIAAKLSARGFDGLWIGGEVVIWNYAKLPETL